MSSDVARRVDVGADVEEHLLVVVHVDVRVDDDDRLRQAQHPEAPDRVHDLPRVARERLADRDDAAVVERARHGQVVVDDLGHGHPDRGQEDALGRLRPATRPRRAACRRRSTDRSRRRRIVIAGHVEDRELLDRRVVAGVVAERALVGERRRARRSPRARSRRWRAPRRRRSSPFTSSTGSPRRKPASMSSSTCFGSGAERRVGGDRVEPERDGDLEAAVRSRR